VTQGKGRGARLSGENSSALREGLEVAKAYLQANAAKLVGDRDPKGKEWIAEVHPFVTGATDASFGLAMLLALCSSLLKKPLRRGLLVVGALPGEDAQSIKRPTDFIEIAAAEGARIVLLPVSCRWAAASISDEIATQLEIVFFANATDALSKAIQE
jgi:ATP-dependent Lon protease